MIEPKKKKTIYVAPEQRKALCRALGTTKVTFYRAVNYESNSDLAAQIRKEAVENYGGIYFTKTVFEKKA